MSGLNRSWYGGIAYTRALLHSLRAAYGKKAKIYGISHECRPGGLNEFKTLVDDFIIISNLRKGTLQWARDNIERRSAYPDIREERIIDRNGVDVVFGHLLAKTFRKIPAISWVPDFQHINFPEFCSPEEISYRENIFRLCAERCRAVALISENAKIDFKKYLPQFAHKARLVSAVSPIPESIYVTDPEPVLGLYDLPRKFIYLPNQFWKHKNHEAAFMAVKKLKDSGIKICIVCSGYEHDDRHPNYFAELSGRIADWGIKEEVRFLGMIPYEDVLILMRQSICVLNPSLFEGFGLSAGEAKSLGKRALLSDIPAHREQNPDGAVFFKPDDMEDLSDKMARIWRESEPGPDFNLEVEAKENMFRRIQESGRSFMSVLEEAVKCPYPKYQS